MRSEKEVRKAFKEAESLYKKERDFLDTMNMTAWQRGEVDNTKKEMYKNRAEALKWVLNDYIGF